jgi:hypothetical protein
VVLFSDHPRRGLNIMNINSFQRNTASGLAGTGAASSQASNAVSTPTSPQLVKAYKRLQADVDTTTTQLSQFGLLKSAVASSQLTAHALTNLPSSVSAAEVTLAAGNFFNGFNSTISAANIASSTPGPLAASQSANRVINDLKRALASDPATQEAMKKLGLAIQKDGTLTHDAKKFATALSSDPGGVRTALAAIGKSVDSVATKELANSGAVDTGISSLKVHGVALAAQQKAMKALDAAMAPAHSSSPSASHAANNRFSGLGVAAYQK